MITDEIQKVSEITVDDVKNYLRLSETTDADSKYIKTILKVAIDYIKNNTGVTNEEIDNYSDFVIVVFVLCQDMYDTRSYYVDKSNVNQMVQSILNMHSRDLLG